jgi:phosphohistidine phosphatase
MIVYLVRHGDAVPEEVDPLRPLSEQGRAEVEETARKLKEEGEREKGSGIRTDEIWHSGKLRAKQTAEIIARVLDVPEVIEKAGLKPNDPAEPIAALLRESGKTILIAGHLPFIPKLAVVLQPDLRDKGINELKSGGMLRISI